MRKVERSELVDYQSYEDVRDAFRKDVMAAKVPRRIHVGPLTFLFETSLTIRYQVQEMMRAEHIVREDAIQHELDTYNELLGGDGELGCSLLIELADPAERDVKLREWLGLMDNLYAKLADGTKVRATFDPRQVGTDRLSSVQYVKFAVGGQLPSALGADHPNLTIETALTPEQQAALSQDLKH